MKGIEIAVASGKGGTGKTMIATSLAASLAPAHPVQFLDCDVEAPNAHLFLKPEFDHEYPAVIQIPVIDPDKCTLCGDCVRACAFHALAKVGGQILLFPQLCHGCGNCSLTCPEKAITEKPHAIGQIRQGKTKHGITYLMGELTISEPMPTPVIHQLKALSDPAMAVTILDSPPGASCAVVETLHDADFVILVTEPTPFGLHDLKQMLGILEQTDKPSGVMINRVGIGNDDLRCFAQQKGLDILMEIPYQQHIAAELARGRLFSEISPAHIEKFQALYQHLLKLLERKVLFS